MRSATGGEAGHRFRHYVYDDPIAKMKLDKLRRRHVKEWRERLEAQPALVSRRKKGEPVHRERATSTVNRDMAVFRAALAKMLSPGAPNSEAVWQEALKSTPNANGRRSLYLDRSQRQKLLDKTDAEDEPFVRALCLLPLRPGALAVLTAGDFGKRTAELTIGKDKTGNRNAWNHGARSASTRKSLALIQALGQSLDEVSRGGDDDR